MLCLLENGFDGIVQKAQSDLADIFKKGIPLTLKNDSLQGLSVASLPIHDFVPPQHVFICDDASSCLDIAHALVHEGVFPEFSSILCRSQSNGRGQLRRHWHSQEGNLYAALRLPKEHPFDTDAAAPALGSILAQSLINLGFNVSLKWTNDLIQKSSHNTWEKVCGILLEERGDALIAGIGINTRHAPPMEALRKDSFLTAGVLKQDIQKNISPRAMFLSDSLVKSIDFYGKNMDNHIKNSNYFIKNSDSSLTIWGLWLALVESIFLWYKKQSPLVNLKHSWHDIAQECLAFMDCEVCVHQALFHNNVKEDICTGKIVGLDLNGALLLKTNFGIKSIIGGSLLPIEHATRY